MNPPLERVSLEAARRLALVKQGLAGDQPPSTKDGIQQLVERLGCVQMDPMRVVERSHLLVIWSRLGPFDPADLDRLLYEDRALFEFWAHAASIVCQANLPIHRHQMAAFTQGERAFPRKARQWLRANRGLREALLDQLRQLGPSQAGDLTAVPHEPWQSKGWTNAQGIQHMLQLLWRKGEVAVAGRVGNRRLWAASEAVYVDGKDSHLTQPQATRRAAKIALAALGVGTLDDIREYFTRGFYPGLEAAHRSLLDSGEWRPIQITTGTGVLSGEWFAQASDLDQLRHLEANPPQAPASLLSPFDNLIADRARTQRLWDFDYSSELYVPKAKRVYGHYVLPMLVDGRLVGRLDLKMDRPQQALRLISAHAEEADRRRVDVGPKLAQALASLAEFLGAEKVQVSRRVPRAWRPGLVASL